MLRSVVAIREKTLAKDHPDRLASQHELAIAFQANGQVKQAIELLENVVAIKEKTLVGDHPSRLTSQHELARAYQANCHSKYTTRHRFRWWRNSRKPSRRGKPAPERQQISAFYSLLKAEFHTSGSTDVDSGFVPQGPFAQAATGLPLVFEYRDKVTIQLADKTLHAEVRHQGYNSLELQLASAESNCCNPTTIQLRGRRQQIHTT